MFFQFLLRDLFSKAVLLTISLLKAIISGISYQVTEQISNSQIRQPVRTIVILKQKQNAP